LFYNFSGLSNKLKQNKCWGRERFSGERERERERERYFPTRSGRESVKRRIAGHREREI
jgi:hypothetical protein